MNNNQNQKPIAEKTMFIIRIAASLGVILCSLLQLFDVWENAVNLSVPLMGVIMLVQTIQEWKSQRGIAIFSLCCTVFIFICTVVVWFFA